MDTKQYAISREMYKKIKGMNREQLQVFATTIYLDGVKSVETTTIDIDRLREDIGAIKGIGESRLNEIMAVIEKYRS
ncbi:MAG: hypothetical protein IKH75_08030 [Ruminococcus sp.]|nr:hypothetical protein [Ruminococcus sp.]